MDKVADASQIKPNLVQAEFGGFEWLREEDPSTIPKINSVSLKSKNADSQHPSNQQYDDSDVCPVCGQYFDPTVSLKQKQIHVEQHFE
ncbi:unnamed protein product [Didymodactylos carnosus]|uniref:Uncharacterized protein n=1 Tax=Didymodactylos carnosus TaxID=1234261 RepID=A0A815PVU1_9BILA|nr:unnamed protein product [Didymodactylos carnosus]CAF4327125.1 unnamed protein product [Didymodactylos carnosus]